MPEASIFNLLYPQEQTFGQGQVQAPACRSRDGFADAIGVAYAIPLCIAATLDTYSLRLHWVAALVRAKVQIRP